MSANATLPSVQVAVLFVVALLLAPTLPVDPAAAAVREPGDAPTTPTTGRYIVALQDWPEAWPDAAAPTFAGARVVKVLAPLSALLVETTDAEAFVRAAALDSRVRYLEEDVDDAAAIAARPDDPLLSAQHGLHQARVHQAWQKSTGSASVTACVVDTGVRVTHEDLVGPRSLGGINVVAPGESADDDHGHGTHVAGTLGATMNNGVGIAGVAQVAVRSAKALRANGAGPWSAVAMGIAWCAASGSHVIVLSLSGATSSSLVADALDFAWRAGALPVAAAGNVGPCEACVGFPANHPKVMAVACWTRDGAPCADSASGPEVDVVAPGEYIMSTWGRGDQEYRELSGTSMAAPHVAGAAALAWSLRPDMRHEDIRSALQCGAEDVHDRGFDHATGHGLLDAQATVRAAGGAGACARS